MHKQYADKELVEGCIQNDRRCQEFLFKKYFGTMMSLCLRYTHDRDTAMEVVNMGFLRVFKKIHTFKFKGSLEGWIRKLVFHSISDYFRKNAKYAERILLEEKASTIQETALSTMYAEDILKMIHTLPPATRRIFELYAIEGYTHPEIAVLMDISVGTSKWHLSNARQKLKAQLAQLNGQGARRANIS